jgi:hypothetical protein
MRSVERGTTGKRLRNQKVKKKRVGHKWLARFACQASHAPRLGGNVTSLS